MDLIKKYFPEISDEQFILLQELAGLLTEWNEKINLISRKDIPFIFERHILHSLSLAKIIKFSSGSKVLDVGTGGGFPGLPLAILFPQAEFTLVDSIGKKIMVIKDITEKLNLRNVIAVNERAEKIKIRYHFIVSRAVTTFPEFFTLIKDKISRNNFNSLINGILYLKGGDFEKELERFQKKVIVYDISDMFEEEFFQTKKIIYVPM